MLSILGLYIRIHDVIAKSHNGNIGLAGTGLLSPGVWGVPWPSQILADQLTLSQPGGADYAHHISTGTPGILDLPTALWWVATLLTPRPKMHRKRKKVYMLYDRLG